MPQVFFLRHGRSEVRLDCFDFFRMIQQFRYGADDNIRRDGMDMLKKLKGSEVSEDSIKDMEDDLQKLTDKYGKILDDEVESKSKEIMTV